tara:strand:- start:242 stop:364 length:123 start_codon:yes stop_codon:yes gene_type:complete
MLALLVGLDSKEENLLVKIDSFNSISRKYGLQWNISLELA